MNANKGPMSVFTNPADRTTEHANAYIEAILSLLGDRDPVQVLEELPKFAKETVQGLSDDVLRQPEAEGKWSIIEVLQHLADSELVWAYRLRMTLAHDRPELTGYDQDLWAERLQYKTADPEATLEQLTLLRKMNLRLLNACSESDLQRVSWHKERGEESIAHMIRLYAGHDLVHRQQMLRIKSSL